MWMATFRRAASASASSIWWRSPSTRTTQVRACCRSRASAWSKAAAMTSPVSRATEPVTHLAVACGPRRTSRPPLRPPGTAITSCGRRTAGAASQAHAKVAIRLRHGFSPEASRVRNTPRPRRLPSAALRVAGRSPSGRITIPFPSALSTSSTSLVHGTGMRWA